MAEPEKKRLKRGHSFNKIRERLLKNKDAILRAAKYIEEGGYEFCFLKIISCNAAFPCSFSKAWCATQRSLDDPDEGKRVAVRVSDLFDVGIISKFIETTNEIDCSLTDHQLTAFLRLSLFFENADQHQKITKEYVKTMTECSWAAVLGTHVLRKLAVENSMLVTCDYIDKKEHCPCGCLTPIQYGDCSMGHKDVWHGSVDILLGPVAVLSAEEYADDTNGGSNSVEVKKGELKDARPQLLAETIVFSYLQKSGLVPTICMSKDWCKIFMYDPEYDLLYESVDFNLFDRTGHFEITAILFLWLIINYIDFCDGVKDSHEKMGYLSGFKSFLPESVLSIYENNLTKGGCSHASCEKNDKWLKGEFRNNYKLLE